jgi:hypothetical protein
LVAVLVITHHLPDLDEDAVAFQNNWGCFQHSIFETQINSIYGIKSSEKVKNNPISYNTTKIILVCGLFFVFLKLEL